MKVQIRADAGTLYVVATGEFSLRKAKATFLEVIAAIEQHGPQRVLFDGRQIRGQPKDSERFHYAAFIADEVGRLAVRTGTRAPRFAYVLAEPVLDAERFGETVASNRGLDGKAFEQMDAALDWLAQPPAKHHP